MSSALEESVRGPPISKSKDTVSIKERTSKKNKQDEKKSLSLLNNYFPVL